MMSQVKRIVTPCAALALAAALGLGMLAVPARALEYVDLNEPAKLTVSLSDGAYEAYRDDLAKEPTAIPVQVFKVAEINMGGTYNAEEGFADFANELADPAQWKNSGVSETEYWQGVITSLIEMLYAKGDYTTGEEPAEEGGDTEPAATPVPSITVPGPGSNLGSVNIPTVNKDVRPASVTPTYEIELTADNDYKVVLDGNSTPELVKGLYLIVPLTTETQRYEYRFTPSLVSVPQLSNEVGGSPLDPGISMGGSDEWEYEVNAYLKPSQKERLGQLLIRKNLLRYNKTFEGATFVFKIEGVLDGKQVFLDYRALKFQNGTPQEVLVEGIPVGATVTVTEVYSGASYTVQGEGAHTVTIPAMDEQLADSLEKYGEPGKTTAVTVFENDYDGHLRGGESAINEYKYLGKVNEQGTWDDVHRVDEGGTEATAPDNGEGGGTQ